MALDRQPVSESPGPIQPIEETSPQWVGKNGEPASRDAKAVKGQSAAGNSHSAEPSYRTDGERDLHLDGFLAFERIETEHIRNIVHAADTGHPQAQYSMAKLLKSCRYMLESYPNEAILEEKLSRARANADSEFVAGVQREARACFDLRNASSHLERTPGEWMRLAAEGGYGPALAAMAGAYAWGAPLPDRETMRAEDEVRKMRRTLVHAAARTRDPNALFAISGLFATEGPLPRGQPGESLAWVYAACHFGLDCGPDHWMLQWMCRWSQDCDQAYAASLPAYLEYKQYSPAEQDYAARRAPELIRQLEAGDWEALGLEIDGDQTVVRALEKAVALQEQAASEVGSLMGRSASEAGDL